MEIAGEIIDVVQKCRKLGVNEVYVLGLTCRPQYQARIEKINNLLEINASVHHYVYINNTNIKEEHYGRKICYILTTGVHLF